MSFFTACKNILLLNVKQFLSASFQLIITKIYILNSIAESDGTPYSSIKLLPLKSSSISVNTATIVMITHIDSVKIKHKLIQKYT